MVNSGVITTALCALLVTGCVGGTIESGRMTNDKLIRDRNIELALNGDPEAQYKVGLSFCCAPRSDVDAFYNNRKATEFLCKAARRHHAQAAFQIGRFHSGDRINGIRWIRRTANLIRGDNLKNPRIAYYWFQQATLNGSEEASKHIQSMDTQDISQFVDPQSTPCTVDEVYGQPSARE